MLLTQQDNNAAHIQQFVVASQGATLLRRARYRAGEDDGGIAALAAPSIGGRRSFLLGKRIRLVLRTRYSRAGPGRISIACAHVAVLAHHNPALAGAVAAAS